MTHKTFFVVCLGVGLVGCGGVGAEDESVSLASAGVDVTVSLTKGGKVAAGTEGPEVKWVGMSWNASFILSTTLSPDSNHPVAADPSGAFDALTPVTVDGKKYVCWARAKKEQDAKRIQTACDKLAAASPKEPAGGAAKADSPMTFELEEKSAADVGCSIKIPKGAKTLVAGKYNTTYSLPFPDGLNELNVSVNQAGAKSLDDAKRTSTMMGGTVQDAKQLPNELLEVVLAPQGILQTVNTFLPKFGAKCTGPKANLSTLLEMCESLTAPADDATSAKSMPASVTAAKPAPAKSGAAATLKAKAPGK
jgi:hypothetical protein